MGRILLRWIRVRNHKNQGFGFRSDSRFQVSGVRNGLCNSNIDRPLVRPRTRPRRRCNAFVFEYEDEKDLDLLPHALKKAVAFMTARVHL